MADTYESVQISTGSSEGAKVAGNTFASTDGSTLFVPAGLIAWPDPLSTGGYHTASTAQPLPVQMSSNFPISIASTPNVTIVNSSPVSVSISSTANVVIVNSSAVAVSLASTVPVIIANSSAVPVSVASTVPITWTSTLPVTLGGATVAVSVGSTVSVVIANSSAVPVSVASTLPVTWTSTLPVTIGNATANVSWASTLPVTVGGATVAVSWASTLPVTIGGATIAVTIGSTPNVTIVNTTTQKIPTQPYAGADASTSCVVTLTTTTIVDALAASTDLFIHITDYAVVNNGSVFQRVTIINGSSSAGTTAWHIPAPATADTGGGAIQSFHRPLRLSSGAMKLKLSTPSTAGVDVSINGYRGA